MSSSWPRHFNGRNFVPRQEREDLPGYVDSDEDFVGQNWELAVMLLEAFGADPERGHDFLDYAQVDEDDSR